MDIEKLKQIVVKNLEDNKGEDIEVIDISKKSSICHYLIVVSGRAKRHVSSLSEKLKFDLKKAGVKGINIEGKEESEWVLMDIGDIVVHIFVPEIRQRYAIEELWSQHTRKPID